MWIDTGMSFERKKASLEPFIAEVIRARIANSGGRFRALALTSWQDFVLVGGC
jgi:hypothetical protein